MNEVLATYDPTHQISYKIIDTKLKIIILKDGFPLPQEDVAMLKAVYTAYNLSSADNVKNITLEQLKIHMRAVENLRIIDPDELHSKGLSYLNNQPLKPLIPENASSRTIVDINNTLIETITQECVQQMIRGQKLEKLPVLEICKIVLQHPLYRKRYLSSLTNTLFIIMQQGFSTVEHLILSLCDLGIPPENIILLTKPHTSSERNKDAFRALAQSKRIHYVEPKKTFEEEEEEEDYANAITSMISNAMDVVKTRLNETSTITNIVLHDEGGRVVNSPDFIETWNTISQQKNYHIATSEHTISGLDTRERTSLPGPCVAMATSYLKTELESSFIAGSSFDAIEEDLNQLLAECELNNKKLAIGVVGCGNIGSEFISYLVKRAPTKIHLLISEIREVSEGTEANKPSKFGITINDIRQLGVSYECFTPQTGDVDSNVVKIIRSADVVFGCTGKDITKKWQENTENSTLTAHKTILYSLTSGDREFKTLTTQGRGFDFQSMGTDYIYQLSSLSLIVKNRGRPIIFNGQKDDAIHPFKIQISRALTLCSIIQQLIHLSLAERMGQSSNLDNSASLLHYNNRSKPFTALDGVVQHVILEAFQQSQQILRTAYEELSTDGKRLIKPALVDEEFFVKHDFSLESILTRSGGEDELKMKHTKPHEFNYIADFDDNHKLYLLQDKKEWMFRFCKDGVVIAPDNDMRNKFLSRYNFDINNFRTASSIEQLDQIHLVATSAQSRTPNPYRGGLFQQPVFHHQPDIIRDELSKPYL